MNEERREPETMFETVKRALKRGKEVAEERVRRLPGFVEKFLELPLWKKLAVVVLIVCLAGIGYVGAAILSNILSGTTTITGVSVSPETSPLVPDHVALNTYVTNVIVVDNPTGAAMNAKFVFNFTMPITPATDDIDVWVDLDRDGLIENDEKLSGAVHGNVLHFMSPTVSIPTGASNWRIQLRFMETELVGKSVSWKVYIAS